MDRRKFITAIGVGAIAGCSSLDSDDSGDTPVTTPTQTASPSEPSTRTPTQTPTRTPTPEPPEIEEVNLIESFEEFGDVRDEEINSAPAGSTVLVGYRHTTWVHDGEFAATTEIEIRDSNGNRVAFDRKVDEQFVEGNGPNPWDGAFSFTADWEPGEYTATVVIRDDITDKVSEPAKGTFEITKPEPKLEVISAERYSDTYSSGVQGTARNVSEQMLSYAEVSVIFLDSQERQLNSSFDNTNDLAPGREWRFDVTYIGDEDFADYEINTDWSVSR